MSFTDKLMRDRETQIMAISIVFFVLAFPAYFYLAADKADSGAGLNTVNTYVIEGDLTYIELASGTESIADGDTFPIDGLSTDSIDDADELNIIGVRLTISYTELEQTSSPIPGGCAGALGGQPAADSITGMTMHGEFNETATGSNNADSGSHSVDLYWANTSLIGETVNMSKADIMAEIDAGDTGLGAYSGSISVDASAGNAPGPSCTRSDPDEEVTYKLELVVFEYDIVPYFELEGV